MKKSRWVKILAMALALVMLMSVTAFASTTVYFSVNGKTASGSVGVKNAHTEYDSVASYIYAKITYYYRVNNSATIKSNASETSNASTSVTAYTDVRGEDVGKSIQHHNSYGSHRVNSSSTYSTNYY